MEACTFKPTIFTRSRSVHKPVDLFFETKDEMEKQYKLNMELFD